MTDAPAPSLAFVYTAEVDIGPPETVGTTPFGRRTRIAILGGAFEGPGIRGTIVPGGMDWQLQRADGFTVIEADYMMKADDGALIHVINKGVAGPRPDGGRYVRTTPWFEAPEGPHAWLNRAVFVGDLALIPGRRAVRIRAFRVD